MMKRLILFLSLLIWAATASAGNVAAPSLSSSEESANPATSGLQVAPISIQASSAKSTWTSGDLTRDYAKGALRWEWGYFGISHESNSGLSDSYATQASIGYRYNGFTIAYFSTQGFDGLADYTTKGLGFAWAYTHSLLMGASYSEDSQASSNETNVGVAWMLPGQFKVELDATSSDDGTNVTTGKYGALEFQFGNYILGASTNDLVTTVNRIFLAWEPEKGGVTLKAAKIDRPEDATYSQGYELALGWKF